VAGTAPNAYLYRFTGAASVTKIGFAQRIENLNCQDLAGQTATLSVDLSNSLLTTVTWTAWYANTANTFGTLASPTRTSIATGTFTVNSTLTRYSTNITIPAAATTGIEIELSVGAQISGTWNIGDIQLEPGSAATPFEQRPIGMELALCQRYLPSVIATSTNGILAWGQSIGTTAGRILFPLSVRARTAPTGIITNNTNWGYIFSSSGAIGALTYSNYSTPDQLVATWASAVGLTSAQMYGITPNGTANTYILGDGCEL
jgi:hypothetical protein